MKLHYIIIAVVVVLVLGFTFFSGSRGGKEIEVKQSTSTQATTVKSKCVVYITGEVENTGIYEVEEGSRLYEVIDMAGGFTSDARTDSINLARFVFDGEQIDVPSTEDNIEAIRSGKVNINIADVSLLITLDGIGESRAKDIIDYREENGPYKKLEDIMNVKGIKQNMFEKIKDNITL